MCIRDSHITVNQKIVSIPSFQCRLNDIICVKQKNTSKNIIETNLKNNGKIEVPGHLQFDSTKIEAKVLDYCDRADVGLDIKELLVIEYYSRR